MEDRELVPFTLQLLREKEPFCKWYRNHHHHQEEDSPIFSFFGEQTGDNNLLPSHRNFLVVHLRKDFGQLDPIRFGLDLGINCKIGNYFCCCVFFVTIFRKQNRFS